MNTLFIIVNDTMDRNCMSEIKMIFLAAGMPEANLHALILPG